MKDISIENLIELIVTARTYQRQVTKLILGKKHFDTLSVHPMFDALVRNAVGELIVDEAHPLKIDADYTSRNIEPVPQAEAFLKLLKS